MSISIMPGDRVSFFTREYGPGDPLTGRVVRLTGTVTRPVWGRAQNVSIRTDDGRTFCRLLTGVTRIYCTNPGHREGDHNRECTPPANPGNPELRLMRAIYGLCPYCNHDADGSHYDGDDEGITHHCHECERES